MHTLPSVVNTVGVIQLLDAEAYVWSIKTNAVTISSGWSLQWFSALSLCQAEIMYSPTCHCFIWMTALS